MGIVMIECPRTGFSIPTGVRADAATFARTPVFISRTYCTLCAGEHEWFAKDAWVDETPAREKKSALKCEAA